MFRNYETRMLQKCLFWPLIYLLIVLNIAVYIFMLFLKQFYLFSLGFEAGQIFFLLPQPNLFDIELLHN